MSYFKHYPDWTKITAALACLGLVTFARGADTLTPKDVVLPPEEASQEALNQAVGNASLRMGGLDVFPRASATAMYDDNLLISHDKALSDLVLTLTPGLTLVAGDVSTYLPGPVTLDQVRWLLSYSPEEDSNKPQRFVGVDYTPALNYFADHDHFNNVDHTAALSMGYAFSRLSLGLDQDFTRLAEKDSDVGDRITLSTYETRLRSRYDINERTSVEVNGRYFQNGYQDSRFHPYQEVRNEDWLNRQVGTWLKLSVGAAFGFVYPEISPSQTYQQALLRGLYLVTGKLELRPSVGVEFREYGARGSDTVDPVFSLAAVYRPLETTTVTLEAHRRDQPSVDGNYNYQTLGFSTGIRQRVMERFYPGLTLGYDNADYVVLKPGVDPRSNNFFSARVSLDYQPNPHWTAGLFYVYRRVDANISQYTYANNMVGAQISWQF